MHCGRNTCLCTHTGGCVAGWFEWGDRVHNGQTYAQTMPCPTCKPELTQRLTDQARRHGFPNTRPDHREPWEKQRDARGLEAMRTALAQSLTDQADAIAAGHRTAPAIHAYCQALRAARGEA